jgi:hypothetical protein
VWRPSTNRCPTSAPKAAIPIGDVDDRHVEQDEEVAAADHAEDQSGWLWVEEVTPPVWA